MIVRRARLHAITAEWLGADALVTLPPLREPLRARLADWFQRVRRVLDARRLALVVGSALALWGFAGAGYIHAKAALAQVLLRSAWARTLETGVAHKPWPWADTWPVARLSVPSLGIDEIVLAGASGRTLAFGPALSTAAGVPGRPGNAIVSGHRDTSFGFLSRLSIGDRVWLHTSSGSFAYEIGAVEVVDSRLARIGTTTSDARITLVTCYPFDALMAGGPLRYVVSGQLVAASAEPVLGEAG